MQLFYAPDIVLPTYILGEEESKHCIRVLRMGPGDALHLADGRGNLYRAEVEDPNPKRCTVRITNVDAEYEKLPYNLIMAVAPTKNADRFEWFIEKATEVGVARFIPIICEHSERRVVKRDRLEKVAVSAMKQSLKAYLPSVDEPTSFNDLVTGRLTLPDGRLFAGRKLIAHCREDRADGGSRRAADDKAYNETDAGTRHERVGGRRFIGECMAAGDDALILIGPEGDFSQAEVDLALRHGFTAISLGRSRLRTETAALTAVIDVSFINSNA